MYGQKFQKITLRCIMTGDCAHWIVVQEDEEHLPAFDGSERQTTEVLIPIEGDDDDDVAHECGTCGHRTLTGCTQSDCWGTQWIPKSKKKEG